MKLVDYLKEIKSFLKNYLETNKFETYVLGLSGGVDSSLAAVLTAQAVGAHRLKCIMIPIDSNPDDLKDALTLVNHFGLDYLIIDGSNSFHETVKRFEEQGISLARDSLSNLKVRIRMTILYAYAQSHQGLVIGTDNWDERYTGYFTKFGDGAADIMPLVHLTKGEVVESSRLLGIPEFLANRTPSAGLFPGQIDESEMGVTYQALDDYLLGKEIDKKDVDRIERLHRISQHKRDDIPTPIKFVRD